MANTELASTGLRPWPRQIQVNYYQANTALALFRFQPVIMNNSGQVQTISLAADNSGILGSLIGFVRFPQLDGLPPNLTDLTQNAFLDATPGTGSNVYAAVADHPDQQFVIEADTGGTAIGSANSSGYSARMTYTATTGNTTTGISTVLLDRSTITADTAGILKLIRPYNEYINTDGTQNDVTLASEKWIVKINKHQAGPGAVSSPVDRPS